VIALAARNVPAHLRKKAIVWGTVGAIVVRSAMTVVVVWLLKIPGLMLIGGLALVWIAYKLLVENEDEDAHPSQSANSFWGAMKTIIIADAVMGLDNVLGVAGAAHGNFLLVILGLLISIPIVIWGSQLILKWVDRFPVIIYLGAAVLAWTAVKMVAGEPLLKDFVAGHQWLVWTAYFGVIGGVLTTGFLANYSKVRLRVAAHVVEAAVTPVAHARSDSFKGDVKMLKVLVPVDGSTNSLQAVRHVINQYVQNHPLELHLLHVRTPFSRHVGRFLSRRDLASYYRDEAEKALKPARGLLESFSVPYACHIEIGDKAKTIVSVAKRLHVDQIMLGTARKNSLTRLVEDSVTNRVLELTPVPVEVIAGKAVSKLERYGVPAGIGTAIALLLFAAD
jgi:YjbE family integral membrane protein